MKLTPIKPTLKHWIMLNYWHLKADIDRKQLCRLPASGYGPESLELRGVNTDDLNFIQECYEELRMSELQDCYLERYN